MSFIYQDSSLLQTCWSGSLLNSTISSESLSVSVSAFETLSETLSTFLVAVIGYSVFTLLSGFSFVIAAPCLFYLLKFWRNTPTHYIISFFSTIITSFGVATYIMKTLTISNNIKGLLCPNLQTPFSLNRAFQFVNLATSQSVGANNQLFASSFVGVFYPHIFLFVTDLFLIYRTWIIWLGHRKFVILPAVIWVLSVALSIFSLIQYSIFFNPNTPISKIPPNQAEAWAYVLSTSCFNDLICTGMIAGRLILLHRRRAGSSPSRDRTYLSLMVLFIESGCLSTISKVIEFALFKNIFVYSLLFIPLCTISSNLIILRKALGLDVDKSVTSTPRVRHTLSTIRFNERDLQTKSESNASPLVRNMGAVESILIRTIGGPTLTTSDDESVREVCLDDINSRMSTVEHTEVNVERTQENGEP